mmetsp:Transcript_30882/g.69279  ORF Transcript_30882/g.69279 Transcript_30882/m.69279 type:complete len:351 (+) Transcript_30882:25-1077(+)
MVMRTFPSALTLSTLAFLMLIAVLTDQIWTRTDEQYPRPRRQESLLRTLRTAERRILSDVDWSDPRTEEKKILSNHLPVSAVDLSVHFYIKTSGLRLYLSRAVKSADTWARDTDSGSVTFLFDNHQADVVNEFGAEKPWIAIRHVEGTDKQGEYKGRGDKKAAIAAQHLKTRAVLDSYLTGPIPDWVCYLDDDMSVNVAVLKEDLLELSPSCSPDCLIAHGELFNENPYTIGGYCMQSNLVKRLATLFSTKTDAELGWTQTDDVDFNRRVMQDALGVTVTNSERWYSEFAFPEVDEYGDFHKHSMHELSSMYGAKAWDNFSERKKAAQNDVELMARFVPNVAVYHMGYEK